MKPEIPAVFLQGILYANLQSVYPEAAALFRWEVKRMAEAAKERALADACGMTIDELRRAQSGASNLDIDSLGIDLSDIA